jgi:hypothetical protein
MAFGLILLYVLVIGHHTLLLHFTMLNPLFLRMLIT